MNRKLTMSFVILATMLLLWGTSCDQSIQPLIDTEPDTTSHNFVWKIDTFGGGGGSSVLNDVFIIDDNDIWAVGEIYVKDSTGKNELRPYNAVHWDGLRWQLKRFYYTFRTDSLVITSIRGVYAFGPNDVWFAAGSVFRWDGNSIQAFLLRSSILTGSETVEKLWGVSTTNLYGVGNAGAVVYYDGREWRKLASGTSTDMQDIWGAVDSRTGEQTIIAVASNLAAIPQNKKLMQIRETSVNSINDAGLPFSLSGIWFVPNKKYFVVGSGVFSNDILGQPWLPDTTQPPIYTRAIRGEHKKDIVLVGSYGMVSHYNGVSWEHYREKQLPNFNGEYLRVSYKNGILVGVGWQDEKAIIVTGRRIK